MEDPRLDVYMYYKQLMQYLHSIGKDESVFFNGEVIYPRQFEIHLSGNHKTSCQLACKHCAGKLFDKTLGTWEREGLELLDNLKGRIPFHIYGGAYTEPLLNPYYMAFLNMTKKYDNHFGIHTNGVGLNWLEDNQGWLTELNRISTDDVDYLSISIDAGLSWDWAKTKGTKDYNQFYGIMDAVRKACDIRDKNGGKGHAIRLCYLISPQSGNWENFASIVAFAKKFGVDSLRFSIPFGNYNQDFDKIREYKRDVETPKNIEYYEILKEFLSESKDEKPYIFYTDPHFTDIDEYTFDKCLYGYYQITLGADDGWFYKCSTCATPTAKQNRLGKVTTNVEEFEKMLLKNYNESFDCKEQCFDNGIRCNRMGLEINKQYYEDNR